MKKEDVLRCIAEALGIEEDEHTTENSLVRQVRQLAVQVGMERVAMFWVPEYDEYISVDDLNALETIIAGAFLGQEDEDLPTDRLPDDVAENLRAICDGITLDAQTSATSDAAAIRRVLDDLRAELGEYVH